MTKKTLFVDFDSPIVAAASMCEKKRCVAIHNFTGKERLFDSKTHFNTWIKQQTDQTKDDFHFRESPIVVKDSSVAFSMISNKVDEILQAVEFDEWFLCIQGDTNFRKDRPSVYVDYKGQRGDKPILFKECVDYVKRKYKKNLIISDGEETDDVVNKLAWKSYRIACETKKKSDAPYIIGYIDKDIIANGRGLFINYNKLDEGIHWVNEFNQAHGFWIQTLMGDTIDNIGGIMKLSDFIINKYGLRKSKGCGLVAATKILEGAKTEKEMARRVVQCYKKSWGKEWYKCLDENAFHLYLRREDDEMFVLSDYLDGLGVKYGKI